MLIRFDPYRELDRLTEQLASTASRAPPAFPMDAYRRGEQFIVQFDLPGVEPAAIELTVEQNVLTVRAERRFEPRQDDEVLVAERPHGSYTCGRSSSATRSTPKTCRRTASTVCSRSRSRSLRRLSRAASRSAGARTPKRSSRRRPAARRQFPHASRPERRRRPRAEPPLKLRLPELELAPRPGDRLRLRSRTSDGAG
jgi:hypothetical protein